MPGEFLWIRFFIINFRVNILTTVDLPALQSACSSRILPCISFSIFGLRIFEYGWPVKPITNISIYFLGSCCDHCLMIGIVCDVLHPFGIFSSLIHLVNTTFNIWYSFVDPAVNNSPGEFPGPGAQCGFICWHAFWFLLMVFRSVLGVSSSNSSRSSARNFSKYCFHLASEKEICSFSDFPSSLIVFQVFPIYCSTSWHLFSKHYSPFLYRFFLLPYFNFDILPLLYYSGCWSILGMRPLSRGFYSLCFIPSVRYSLVG